MNVPFVNLHTVSWYSFLRGPSSPEDLVRRAATLGMESLALTDYMGVSGLVEFQQACNRHGIHPVIGAEVQAGEDLLVLLAQSREGYTNLCDLISRLSRYQEGGLAGSSGDGIPEALSTFSSGLVCLAGGRGSRLRRLLADGEEGEGERSLLDLRAIYGDRLYVELANHLQEGESSLMEKTARLARDLDIDTIATNAVRYAEPEEYDLCDLLTCIRLAQTVHESHPERPPNQEAYLKRGEDLYPYVLNDYGAIARTIDLARSCQVELLPDRVTPPAAWVPAGTDARRYLRELCEKGIEERLPQSQKKRGGEQLEKELETIFALDLEEFFLVVREVMMEARNRNIRYAGRGSAVNSIVCYLLYISHINPIDHHLLFERFLHTGRRGTPDIDVDFDSERRDEIIDWIEGRFGRRHTAMTATYVRYRLRSALRDTAKALGWPMELVNDLGKSVPHTWARSAPNYRDRIEETLGHSPLVDTLIVMAQRLDECPRYLGQHSGGMMLCREPLSRYTPVKLSANGVRIGQHDKDGVEGLGVIKFDVLGLRMLACISEGVELLRRHEGIDLDTEQLDLEDPEVYRFLRSGRTLGLFQIESGGQMHLIARSQPEHFHDLITQVAIFRPGPVQSGMVHPYIRRRRGLEPVEYLHPDLEPILKDTLGVILFQEQILDIAHRFAGMSLREADEFRRLMSRFRSHEGMQGMKDQFVNGAVARGVDRPTAEKVFENVSYFVGYGFCRSHAAAFARTVFISAYLKLNHPAAYMAAFMQMRPGMYPQMTLEQEALRFGAPTLLPDIRFSSVRYELEPNRDRKKGMGEWSIRKPLTAIRGLSDRDARQIVLERLNGPFLSIEDLYRRLPISRDALEALAISGALDAIAGDGRTALWQIGVLANRLGTLFDEEWRGEKNLFNLPALQPEDIPDLPPLNERERVAWDLRTHSSARTHPVALIRRHLNDWEVRPIASLFGISSSVVSRRTPFIITTAGLVVMRQRPSTAKGTVFIMLEDETAFIQIVVFPTILDRYPNAWSQGGLIVRGELQMHGDWRGLVVQHVWPLDNVIGGYTGFPGADGGRDRMVVGSEESDESFKPETGEENAIERGETSRKKGGSGENVRQRK